MILLKCTFFPVTDNREHLIHSVYKFLYTLYTIYKHETDHLYKALRDILYFYSEPI